MNEPDVGLMRPARILNNVVLPEPDGPSTHTNSRGCTSNVIPPSACSLPFSLGNTALRFWMMRIGVGGMTSSMSLRGRQPEAISSYARGLLTCTPFGPGARRGETAERKYGVVGKTAKRPRNDIKV